MRSSLVVQGRHGCRVGRSARVVEARTASSWTHTPLIDPLATERLRAFDGHATPTVDGDVARWFRAYRALWTGDFGTAEALARSLFDAQPNVAHAARITLGAVLRHVHDYEEAEAVDRAALERSSTDAERVDAHISLGADAIGALDADVCEQALTRAARDIPSDDERLFIRLDWVRTEHALLSGRPSDAVTSARRALMASRARGWPRHIAKSALFAGAACDAAGRADESLSRAAERHLAEALDGARSIGAAPIADVAASLLGARASE